jgi:hypothetical protein
VAVCKGIPRESILAVWDEQWSALDSKCRRRSASGNSAFPATRSVTAKKNELKQLIDFFEEFLELIAD